MAQELQACPDSNIMLQVLNINPSNLEAGLLDDLRGPWSLDFKRMLQALEGAAYCARKGNQTDQAHAGAISASSLRVARVSWLVRVCIGVDRLFTSISSA